MPYRLTFYGQYPVTISTGTNSAKIKSGASARVTAKVMKIAPKHSECTLDGDGRGENTVAS